MESNLMSQWSPDYVRKNPEACIREMKETNERIISFLQKGDDKSAVAGMDRLLNSAVAVNNSGVCDMKTFLADNSASQGMIIVCGLDGVSDAKRRQTALTAFEDALDFSQGRLSEFHKQMISDLKNGVDFDTLRARYGRSFPHDVIRSLSKNTQSFETLLLVSQQQAIKAKKRRKKIIILVSLAITVISALTATKLTVDHYTKRPSGSQTEIEREIAQTQPPTEPPTEPHTEPPTEPPTEEPEPTPDVVYHYSGVYTDPRGIFRITLPEVWSEYGMVCTYRRNTSYVIEPSHAVAHDESDFSRMEGSGHYGQVINIIVEYDKSAELWLQNGGGILAETPEYTVYWFPPTDVRFWMGNDYPADQQAIIEQEYRSLMDTRDAIIDSFELIE